MLFRSAFHLLAGVSLLSLPAAAQEQAPKQAGTSKDSAGAPSAAPAADSTPKGSPDAKKAEQGGGPPKSGGGGGGGGGPPPANVVLAPVTMESITQQREVTGDLRAWRRSKVAAEEEGRITSIAYEEGDVVKEGQVLVQLDDSLARIQVARNESLVLAAQRQIEEREAELDRAQREQDRIERMSDKGGMSESDLDVRRTAVITWTARLAQARADLETANNNLKESRRHLERMAVKAPFRGNVVQKVAEVGEWVRAGDVIAEVVDTTAVEVRLDVPAALAAQLKTDDSVRISVPSAMVEADAKVFRVVADADSMSRLIPVRVRLDNKEGRLVPGMSATGLVATSQTAPSITVSKDAILRDDAGTYVYFDANGAAIPMRVRVRYTTGDRAVLEPGGLAPGMRVLVEGNERIMFPGQPLNVLSVRGGDSAPAQSPPGQSPMPPAKHENKPKETAK